MTDDHPQTLTWIGQFDGHLELIDQTKLPRDLVFVACHDVETVWEAIRSLQVRGAPAIGIAAAYGICLGLNTLSLDKCRTDQVHARLVESGKYLATSRPTAVNLFWAIQRMTKFSLQQIQAKPTPTELVHALLDEARRIHDEDRIMCHAIGKHGATLLQDGQGVITHCNAGGLATSEYGTALSLLFAAQDQGKQIHVYVDETRPLLQGARLTTWELQQRNMDVTLICDNMAAQVMQEGKIQAVVTGADRIAANGDVANKIGTYALAILAQHHGIPVYIAAPSNTFDLQTTRGTEIPIECRSGKEITHGFGSQTAPADIQTYNPAFDVTPADLITAIITERGIITPVNRASVAALID
ncbi:MAG: S-methyl-5-thioribose-1-phosphate isomerase [Planctomycetota bacterium]|nr:S-methyl-5-thioribose-1-phosphate isomerase [Planctomycetota bacterium]